MPISLLKSLLGPWDMVKGNLLKDLEKIQTALNGIPPSPTYLPPRSAFLVTGAYPAINTDTTDIFCLLRLDTNVESFTMNLQGTPVNGQQLMVRVMDDGTPRTLTWGPKFADANAMLPTTTSGGSVYNYTQLCYNTITQTWDCII